MKEFEFKTEEFCFPGTEEIYNSGRDEDGNVKLSDKLMKPQKND